MASDDDEDLEALRNAVLASMKNRPKDAAKDSLQQQPVGTVIGKVVQQKEPVLPRKPVGNTAPIISISKRNDVSAKTFSKKVNMKNLIVLTTQPARPDNEEKTKSKSETKPTLLRPQDKWDLPSTVTSASPQKSKGNDKFSRYDSSDSESDSADSDNDSDDSNNVTTEKDGDVSSSELNESDTESDKTKDISSDNSDDSDSDLEKSHDESSKSDSQLACESQVNDSPDTSSEAMENDNRSDDEANKNEEESDEESVENNEETEVEKSNATDIPSKNNQDSFSDSESTAVDSDSEQKGFLRSEDNKENFKHDNTSFFSVHADQSFDDFKHENDLLLTESHKSKQESSKASPQMRDVEKHSNDRNISSKNQSSSRTYSRQSSLRKQVLDRDGKHSRNKDVDVSQSRRRSEERRISSASHRAKDKHELNKMEERRKKFESTSEISHSKGTISLKGISTKRGTKSETFSRSKSNQNTEKPRKKTRRRSSDTKKLVPRKEREQASDTDSDSPTSTNLPSNESDSDSDTERVTWRYSHTGKGNESSGSNPSGPLFERKREDLERERRLRRLENPKKKHSSHHKSKSVENSSHSGRTKVMTSLDTKKTMLHKNKVFVDEEVSDNGTEPDRRGPISIVKPNDSRTHNLHHRLGAQPSGEFSRRGGRQTSDLRREVYRRGKVRENVADSWNQPESENSDNYDDSTLVVPSRSKHSVRTSQSKHAGEHYILTVKEEAGLNQTEDSSESDGPVVNVVISGKHHLKGVHKAARSVHSRLGDSVEGLSEHRDRSYKRKKTRNEPSVNTKLSHNIDYAYEPEYFSDEQEISSSRQKRKKRRKHFDSGESDEEMYSRRPVKMPNEIELDERIKQIQEKNAAYRRRRQEVLLDKKIYG